MLVYGDAVRAADPHQVLADLRLRLSVLDGPGPAVERHARLAGIFILAAELAQGLADSAMAAQDGDGPSPQEDAALALVMELAGALLASWAALGDQTAQPVIGAAIFEEVVARLQQSLPPAEVQLKTAEGYAFYALYPEAYAVAALQLAPSAIQTVIGIRSIGSGLAAVVARAVGAERVPATVRPIGHPFQRILRLQPGASAQLRAGVGGGFVIVDEGPGLSGSSFGAVADALEAMGAAPSSISFLPGHGGDLGAQASEAHRARWATAARPCVSFDALVLHAEPRGHRLQSWFEDLTQTADAAVADVSGGGWRALRYADEAAWPAANTHQERRKFILSSSAGGWLLKFAGLGPAGERAFVHAKALAAAGFAPPS